MSTNPSNEKFVAFEFGLNTKSNDGTLAGKLNVYNTSWNDRIATRTVENEDGDEDIIYLTGINQVHTGVETEFAAQINEMFRADIGEVLEIGDILMMLQELIEIVMEVKLVIVML